MRDFLLIASVAFIVTPAVGATPETVSAMKWRKRVVLAESTVSGDADLTLQRHMLEAWRRPAASRDVTLVVVDGDHVVGVSDSASALRQRYQLRGAGFQAVLIGKDGRVGLRSKTPITGADLQSAIDAMPMRKAGQR